MNTYEVWYQNPNGRLARIEVRANSFRGARKIAKVVRRDKPIDCRRKNDG